MEPCLYGVMSGGFRGLSLGPEQFAMDSGHWDVGHRKKC